MAESQAVSPRSWRPRFSILTALLLITITGMAILIVQLWREVGPLRTEVRKLRDEVGALTIEDESKIYAIQMPTNADYTWKWRIWVPKGANISAHYRWGDVPLTAVPEAHRASRLYPGENIVTLHAFRNRDGNRWGVSFSTPSESSGVPIDSDQQWFDWPQMVTTGEGVGTSTELLDDKSSVHILSRQRVGPYSDSSILPKIAEPTAGFIIWLERH
jgi:hypothetical protein